LQTCTQDVTNCPDNTTSTTCTIPYTLPNTPGVCGSLNGTVMQTDPLQQNKVIVQSKTESRKAMDSNTTMVDVVLTDVGPQ
jgi:hypothetical protein